MGRPGKIAALSNGRDVFYGREGEIIDGRYRMVKIGVEPITMEYPTAPAGERFHFGLSVEEAGDVLGLSRPVAYRNWKMRGPGSGKH